MIKENSCRPLKVKKSITCGLGFRLDRMRGDRPQKIYLAKTTTKQKTLQSFLEGQLPTYNKLDRNNREEYLQKNK